MNKYENMICI